MTTNGQWYVVVDDQSPRIQYQGDWLNQKSTSARNGTLSVTSSAGSSATFSFKGNFVAVNGPVLFQDANDPPISTYSIDGQTPGIFVPSLEENNTFTTFFVSPQLSDAQHTLTISLASDGVPFFLDAILFNASSVAQVTSAGQQPTIITTVIVAATSAPNSSTTPSKKAPVGPIVGGVVGGIVLLVSALLAWYFFRVKQRRGAYGYRATAGKDTESKPFVSDYDITPFQTPPQPQAPPPPRTERTASVYSTSSYRPTDPMNAVPPLPGHAASSQTTLVSVTPLDAESAVTQPPIAGSSRGTTLAQTTVALTPAQRKAQEAQSRVARQNSSAEPVMHTDSGYRFDAAGSSRAQAPLLDPEIPDELPPTYSER